MKLQRLLGIFFIILSLIKGGNGCGALAGTIGLLLLGAIFIVSDINFMELMGGKRR